MATCWHTYHMAQKPHSASAWRNVGTPVRQPHPFQRGRVHSRRTAGLAARSSALQGAEPPAATASGSSPTGAELWQRIVLRPLQPHPAELDSKGLVPCTASLEAVPPPLLPLLEAAVAKCCEQLGSSLVGVYLRGSLVQGGFLPTISDADFFALCTGNPSSSVASQLQQAAQCLQGSFPQCAKIELKVVPLLPGSILSRRPQIGSDGGDTMHILQAAVLEQPSLAFQLKTQAVCLYGWDAPRLLPEVAALPPLQLLPSLQKDVAAALQHAQHDLLPPTPEASSGSSSSSAARAVRWALKRCIRAAFELYFCSTSSSSSSSSGGSSSKVYSRDLYWCLQYATQQHPELQQPLATALQLYLALAPAAGVAEDAGSASITAGAAGSTQKGTSYPRGPQKQQGKMVEEGMRVAGQLAGQIVRRFLQAMLTEEPGWLTYHGAAAQAVNLQPTASSSGLAPKAGNAGSDSSALGWWQQLRVRMWAAALAGDGAGGRGDLEGELVGSPAPPIGAAVSGSILTFDWSHPEAQQEAAAIIAATFGTAATGPTALLPGRAAAQGLLPPQPVLLKGAAAHWPAVRRWSLSRLASAGLEGRVRVAPSLQFPFTEPKLAAILAAQQGVGSLPSCVSIMRSDEFAVRMQRGNPCRLPPLVYGGRSATATALRGESKAGAGDQQPQEFYYLQAELPEQLLADIDLTLPPFAPLAPAPRLRQTQAARVWASPCGAVSPTHYDLSHSFLTQVKGRKRMLFWSPDQLPYLYCYPDMHLLRRRSRVNMHAPDLARFPLLARATAHEALLEPGDVVFFQSRWAHYTESLDFSISVTCRFEAAI